MNDDVEEMANYYEYVIRKIVAIVDAPMRDDLKLELIEAFLIKEEFMNTITKE